MNERFDASERADASERSDASERADASERVDAVLVRLGSGRYALPMSHVAEVGRVPALTRVPGLPGWLAGVANWRGRILPVVDPRPLLGAAPGPEPGGPPGVTAPETARLLVLAAGGVSAGFLVDEVTGTASLDPDRIEPFPPTLPVADLVAGQVPGETGPVAVVDADAVLALRDRLPQGRRTA